MKINELKKPSQLDEGIADFAKQAWAGAKGAVQGIGAGGIGAGAKAGWQAQGAANQQADLIKNVTTKALQDWAKIRQSIEMSKQEVTAKNLKDWFTKFSGRAPTGDDPAGTNPAQAQQWIQQQVANYIAQKAMADNGMMTPAGGPTAQPQGGGTGPELGPQGGTGKPEQPQAGGVDFPPDLSGYTPEQLKQLKAQLQA